MNDFETRRTNRISRLKGRAAEKRTEADALHTANRRVAEVMNGTPVLIGHHSEGRHRRDLDRMQNRTHSAIALTNAADILEARAKAAETNTAIFSDDPEALSKLKGALSDAEADHARMVKGNAALRKAKDVTAAASALRALGFSDAAIGRALVKLGPGAPWYGFNLPNAKAEIRRLKARIETLTVAPAKARPDVTKNVVTVTWNVEANRVRVYFPDKPDANMRNILKAHGFKWAPSVGAWQRHASESAWSAALQITGAVP